MSMIKESKWNFLSKNFLNKLEISFAIVNSIYSQVFQFPDLPIKFRAGETRRIQCDAIRWKQFEHFLVHNFWINDLILILKTHTCPTSVLVSSKKLPSIQNLSKRVVHKL